jgi:hypothetical protein
MSRTAARRLERLEARAHRVAAAGRNELPIMVLNTRQLRQALFETCYFPCP